MGNCPSESFQSTSDVRPSTSSHGIVHKVLYDGYDTEGWHCMEATTWARVYRYLQAQQDVVLAMGVGVLWKDGGRHEMVVRSLKRHGDEVTLECKNSWGTRAAHHEMPRDSDRVVAGSEVIRLYTLERSLTQSVDRKKLEDRFGRLVKRYEQIVLSSGPSRKAYLPDRRDIPPGRIPLGEEVTHKDHPKCELIVVDARETDKGDTLYDLKRSDDGSQFLPRVPEGSLEVSGAFDWEVRVARGETLGHPDLQVSTLVHNQQGATCYLYTAVDVLFSALYPTSTENTPQVYADVSEMQETVLAFFRPLLPDASRQSRPDGLYTLSDHVIGRVLADLAVDYAAEHF